MELLGLVILSAIMHMRWIFKEKERPKKIFVVEDSAIDRELFRMHFRIENCAIEFFNSTEGIIKEFLNGRPDAVIIDYYLAGKTTGDKLLEFCQNNHIEALLVTGHEGDILGVSNDKIVRKTHDGSHYDLLNRWAREVLA